MDNLVYRLCLELTNLFINLEDNNIISHLKILFFIFFKKKIS